MRRFALRPPFAQILAAALLATACSDKPTPLTSEQETQLAPFIATETPPNMIEAGINFDGKIRLVGYLVSPKAAIYGPGSTVHVMLVWRAEKELEPGWELFTHLVAEDGRQLAIIDGNGPLRRMSGFEGQPLPPSRWKPGRFYIDTLTFVMPGDPSPYVTVAAGIVHAEKGRLPIAGEGGDGEHRTKVIRLRTGRGNERGVVKELALPKLAPGTEIAVDGRLDEPAWATAPATGPFVDPGSGRKNRALPVQGSARLLWDDAHLYVAFEVQDLRVAGGFAPDTKDPHLWERDTVEIMIDPDGDGDNKDYYEIQINPQNLVFDSQFDDYNAPRGGPEGPFGHEAWSAGLKSAVVVRGTLDDNADQDQGYTVEASIPWASFAKAKRSPPAPGDAWRMNFYAMQNNGGAAWSPIFGEGNFHRARRFGRIRFLPAPGDPAAAPSASASAGRGAASPPSKPSVAAPAAPPASPAGKAPAVPAGKTPDVWAGHPDR